MPRVADRDLLEALRIQHAGFTLGSIRSPLYESLGAAAIADVERGGPCARVLEHAPAGLDPFEHAVPLRFLGALHRIVLDGRAPELARWYPSAGGDLDPATDDPAAAFLAAVEAHEDELVAGLAAGVQTNEVSRCAALAVGYTHLLRAHGLPLRLLEIGTSAGLNLRWDRFRYEAGTSEWGDPGAALRFADDVYAEPSVDVGAPLGPADAVAERRGCDRSPIDPTTDAGRLLLRSFVWPDQVERLARLDAALDADAAAPAAVDAADAGDWVPARLAEPATGVTTVVVHSIVWQYVLPEARRRVVDALAAAGATATPDAPVAWLRMEPGAELSERAEVRLTSWAGAGDPTEVLLARTGFHGRPVTAIR